VIESEENGRELTSLVVPRDGRLVSTGERTEPYRLLDADGDVVEPVAVFLRELLAAGRSVATLRSYGMDSVALVAVPTGARRLLGPGQPSRGTRLQAAGSS
jgi:hypothetical protein